MLPELDYYDWGEVFKYAAEEYVTCAGHNHIQAVTFGAPVAPTGFTRDDVATIVARAEGENDGASWVMVVLLYDGRFAVVRASCDYTGWG